MQRKDSGRTAAMIGIIMVALMLATLVGLLTPPTAAYAELGTPQPTNPDCVGDACTYGILDAQAEEGTTSVVPDGPSATLQVDGTCTDSNSDGLCDDNITYKTIQAAITAASPGDTINVAAATYVEVGQIVVAKNLTIVGADRATTIIKPAQDTGSSGDPRGWFLVNSGITFNLSKVTLDGQGKNIMQGIRSHGTGELDNIAYKDIVYPGYNGLGVVIFGQMIVSNSTFQDIGRVGVIVFGSTATAAVTGNTYTGKGPGDWLDYAIEAGGGGNATITGNTITDCEGVASVDGSTSAGILASTYYGAGTAATITNNFVTGNTRAVFVGYDASDTAAVTISDNDLSGNGVEAVASTAPSVDASGNWWGSATAATVKTAANGGLLVDFTPWLANGSDTNVASGFQGDFATLWVDDDSPQTDATGRIEEGIDLVSGSTVNVAAGTYAESIDVDVDNLTLLGPNTGIDPNGATPRNAEAVIQPTASYGIYVEAQNVTIDGLTIDGQGTALYGIYAYTSTGDGDLLLTNSIVKNIVTYGFIGWVQSGAPSSDNLVTKNLFDSIQGRSIVALWNYYADVVNNVVQKTAIGIYAENANQPESTGTVEWKQNKISATRAGIWYNLVYGTATALTISDNIIDVEDNPAGTRWDGIWLTSLGGSVNPTISGNVITGAPVTQLTIGYHMWNNTTTATDGIVVQGGTVTDVDYGVWINNWDGYPTSGGSNAGHSNAKMDGVTIDGAELAGVYLKDNPSNTSGASAYVYANIQNSTIKNSGIGILVDGVDASVKANSNGIFGNTQGMVNNNAATTMDAEYNWWGTACNPAPLMSGLVDFTPWWGDPTGSFSLSASATTINPGDSAAKQMAVINCAAPGATVTYPTPAGSFPGGIIVTANDVTINLNGSTVGFGSPAYTIVGDDVTLTNGILDGTGEPSPASPGVLVQAGADNFILDRMQVKNWADGVQVAGVADGDIESLKIVNNWIHSNTGSGLLVDKQVAGVVTIEGNLFKVNGVGVSYGGAGTLDAEYNSWGADAGPTGLGANVDFDPWTFAEVYIDVDPDTSGDQYVRGVDESTSFDVDLNVDGENLYGLSFEFTYDPAYLIFNSVTWTYPWSPAPTGPCIDSSTTGVFRYVCFLTSGLWDGGTVATFNFTANGTALTGDGSWSTYFDISADSADTNAGAAGGVNVFVNNAGFNDPSTPDRDITNNAAPYDGEIIITGIAQFTGFVDVQGRPNDSGALVSVYNQSATSGATLLASGTSASSGKYTTSYNTPNLLTIGTGYYFQVDRALYLPTTVTNPGLATLWVSAATLNLRPLTSLTAQPPSTSGR